MARGKRRRFAFRRSVHAWHRRVGLAVATVVAVMVATGLPLNHVDRLGLDRAFVRNEALLDWYGMAPRDGAISFPVGANWLTWLQGSLYLNDRPLGETADAITGAVAVDDLLVVAAPREMLLFTADGALVEKLSGGALPGEIEAIGRAGTDRVTVRTAEGLYSADSDFLEWAPGRPPVGWSRPRALPAELEAAILKSYRGAGLPWSRVLLDLHTGRILGGWGPYLMDAAALGLLVLAATGFYNWLGRPR